MTSTLIKHAMVVFENEIKQTHIRIDGDKISDIGLHLETADEVVDAQGHYLLPGFIDAHTHFDLNNGTFRTSDGFVAASKAAIFGGTTTIVDFITQEKGETLKEALSRWHILAKGCSCDYAFHMSPTRWNEHIKEEIKSLKEEGIRSYKAYMAYDAIKLEDDQIIALLQTLVDEKALLGVHCENGTWINENIKKALSSGEYGIEQLSITRPPKTEADAIKRLLLASKKTGGAVQVVHLSSKEGLDVVKAERSQVRLNVETCPQYLLFDDDKFKQPKEEAIKYTFTPPLRKADDRRALIEGLREGYIDSIGTDHCSFSYSQKLTASADFTKVPCGIAGVEHRGVLMLSLLTQEGFDMPHISKLLSTNAAKAQGMYPQKGAIKLGSDADLVLIAKENWTIKKDNMHQKVDYTVYEGFQVDYSVKDVWLRGKHVLRGEDIIEHTGKYLSRGPSKLYTGKE